MEDERIHDGETMKLRRSIRRLWAAVLSLALVTGLALGLLAWGQLRTPQQIRVEDPGGSRAATLTSDSLTITLAGEQRARLDCHSGLMVREKFGRFVQIDPVVGILLREKDGDVRCGMTHKSCLFGPVSGETP